MHILITGTTNSGTGLLRELLKHPKISTLDRESQAYCTKLPNDHKFGHVKNRLFALYPDIYRFFPNNEKHKKLGKIMKKDLYKNWNTNKKFLMEKSPHNMIRLLWAEQALKPAKFIIIIRNPFVVCEGINRRRKHKIKLCAKHWHDAHKWMLEDIDKVKHKIVFYEKLVDNPQSVIDSIWEFIGVSSVKLDLDKLIQRQNMFGKPFSLSSSPDMNAESLNKLNNDDKTLIWSKVGEVAEKFGYKQCI